MRPWAGNRTPPRAVENHIGRQQIDGITACGADMLPETLSRNARTMSKKTPYNVEFFYRGCMRKSEEWPVVLGAIAFFGAQLGFALFLLFR